MPSRRRLAGVPEARWHRHADILLLLAEEVAVIDNLASRIYLIVWVDPAAADAYAAGIARLDVLAERLRRTVSLPPVAPQPPQAVQRIFAKADYLAAVERAKVHRRR